MDHVSGSSKRRLKTLESKRREIGNGDKGEWKRNLGGAGFRERERAEEDAVAAKPKGVEMGTEAIGIAPLLVANQLTRREG
ncbi:hypothetical protein BHE74_00018085 [Ensete ventricosum]|uniref:Uncharacterized protein n=1 Tax=Ensete ventricosum TaxID=4639 RepID=A0A445MJC8_ENSVE|nr:hypothetical protein BHE74_00018085 [Ensete ventricosum]RZR74326.1 hypothetical protein BHM03_00035455 [Ensete ventricosum]